MIINDDVAYLRASYSGLSLGVHLIALAIFLLSYLWFIGLRWSEARFLAGSTDQTIPLWLALSRYVRNGGENWQAGWQLHWSFLAFAFLLLYNMLRATMLWKTNQLEQRQVVSGLPVRFSLSGEPFWRKMVILMTWLFWIGIIVLTLNTWHFFTQEVPIRASYFDPFIREQVADTVFEGAAPQQVQV